MDNFKPVTTNDYSPEFGYSGECRVLDASEDLDSEGTLS